MLFSFLTVLGSENGARLTYELELTFRKFAGARSRPSAELKRSFSETWLDDAASCRYVSIIERNLITLRREKLLLLEAGARTQGKIPAPSSIGPSAPAFMFEEAFPGTNALLAELWILSKWRTNRFTSAAVTTCPRSCLFCSHLHKILKSMHHRKIYENW